MMKTIRIKDFNGEGKDLELQHLEEEMTYDKALKSCPEGWEMINLTTVAAIHDKVGTTQLGFWFWIKNYKWNKEDWRPVARGYYNDFNFYLDSVNNRRASRGVYVKKVK